MDNQTSKLRVDIPIAVEGKYDKIKLDAIVATPIITLDGFSFFNDKKKQQLFRKYAENGIIILTDSDRAGAFIRSKLRGYTKGTIINVYAPSVIGKEKRKSVSSKDGLLGVEGIDVKTLRTLLTPYEGREKTAPYLTKARMYADGLSGGENSSLLRHTVALLLGLPANLSPNAFAEAINTMIPEDEYLKALSASDPTGGTED